MDVEEPEVKIAVVRGFAVDFAPEWKTKKAGRKIEAREKHCSCSYYKKEGATTSEVVGAALASP